MSVRRIRWLASLPVLVLIAALAAACSPAVKAGPSFSPALESATVGAVPSSPAPPTAAASTASPTSSSPQHSASGDSATDDPNSLFGSSWSHLAWVQVPFPGGYTTGLFGTGRGFIATSQRGAMTTPAELPSWRSTDGINWEPGSDLGAVPGDPAIDALADGPNGLIAISSGAACVSGASTPCKVLPVTLWRSTDDGTTWTAEPEVGAFKDGEAMTAAAGPKGYVAGGTALWWSADGIGWTKASSGLAGLQWIDSVLGYSGGFVAVGHLTTKQTAAWRSADGVHWTRLTLASFTGSTTGRLVLAPNGQIVLTQVGQPGYSWVSTSGADWGRVKEPHDVFWSNGKIALAFGPDAAGTTSAWTSPDGVNWTQAVIDNAAADTPIWPKFGLGSASGDNREIQAAALGPTGLYCDLIAGQWLLYPSGN